MSAAPIPETARRTSKAILLRTKPAPREVDPKTVIPVIKTGSGQRSEREHAKWIERDSLGLYTSLNRPLCK